MTEQAHTPGPWQAVHSDPAEGYDCWWITANHRHNFEKEIATVGGHTSTSEANANLVAAAPDMLTALELALHDYTLNDSVARVVMDAIAKAIGKRDAHSTGQQK